ncbi:MAG TPA: methyltransferase domain-containing protein [Thermoanaerobaculia bacterium]|nr:methyltransferase domain-containing protein [Thermoanaerobaculia bacterium]
MAFSNVYEDTERAEAYATLGFPGTYYLAYRDLPALITEHVSGRRALDFGCGAGRSTRFLRGLGFEAVGVDVSGSMIEMAKRLDPGGAYLLVADGDFGAFEPAGFDLVLAAFPFDNIPGVETRQALLRELARLLAPGGRIVLLGSAPEIYTHEWASFSTRDFPENRTARSGDRVRIVMTDVHDRRPVEDSFWLHRDYLDLFHAADLELLAEHRPLGRDDEPYEWVSETTVSPWIVYVVGRKDP